MILAILFSLLLLIACSPAPDVAVSESFTVISFNVQTLYDGTYTGYEMSPFTYNEGWSKAKYTERIEALAEILKRSEYSSADVIFFQEIENGEVLRDLLSTGLRRRGFCYYGVLDNTSTITTGFISKRRPASLRFHYTESQRPVLECSFSHAGAYLTFLSLHAKSNSGDEEENRALRHAMARHLVSLLEERRSECFVLLGDFNSEVVSDCEDLLASADVVRSDLILASGSIPVTRDQEMASGIVFYDPFTDPYQPFTADGSYFYEGTWYQYDKIMPSGNLISRLSSLEPSILTATADSSLQPWRYDASIGTGYSDHFAVKLRMVF